MFYIINLIAQSLAHSAALKKGLGLGAGGALLAGLIMQASAEHTNKAATQIREEQERKWEEHRRQGDIILDNLNTTLTDLKSGIKRIDDRTDYLYKREIEKNK